MKLRPVKIPGFTRWSTLSSAQQQEILKAISSGQEVPFISWNKITYVPTPNGFNL